MHELATAAFLLSVSLFATAGCSKKDERSDCQKKHDKLAECGEMTGNAVELRHIVELCEEVKAPFPEGEIACTEKKSCDEFRACTDEVDFNRRLPVALSLLKEANSKKDFIAAVDACSSRDYGDLMRNAEFKAACDIGMKGALKSVPTAIAAKRDEGAGASPECDALTKAEQYLRQAPGSVCLEAELARVEVVPLLKETKNPMTVDASHILERCGSTLEQLAKLDTPWSKEKQAELVTACYKRFGKEVIREGMESKAECSDAMLDSLEGLMIHNATDSDFAKEMKKAKKRCGLK